MNTADLEIAIVRFPGGTLAATFVLTPPDGSIATTLAQAVPVALDEATLRAASNDAAAYGRALTAQLFADRRARDAWARASGYASAAPSGMRVRLRLGPDDALHALRWETLHDPLDDVPLALNERIPFSRFLDSPDLTPISIPSRPDLRAAIVVANPSDLDQFNLAAIDVEGEVARARAALGNVPVTIVGDHPDAVSPHATLSAIENALRGDMHVLYLVCHGAIVDNRPHIWLESEGGASEIVSGADFVQAVGRLTTRPLLAVLASCRSAGGGYGSGLAALGPYLAQAGIPAVIGFQGDLMMSAARRLLPALFRELIARDGAIDRAVAAARGVLHGGDWWQAVLWLRMRDGRLWRAATPPVNLAPPGIGAADPAADLVEQVKDLTARLNAVRGQLRVYLHQKAITGFANARPEVLIGITDTRKEIRAIKKQLQDLGAQVADSPDDEGL